MKRSRILPLVLIGLVVSVSATVRAQDDNDHGRMDEQKVKLLGEVTVPGNPISSTDIIWADQTTGLVVFSDRSNAGVDVINGVTDLFVGRATTNGPAATIHFQGVTSPSTHEGPNGVVTTNDQKVFAGDGDSTVKVADLDPSSPTYLQIIAVVSTAMFDGTISNCTGGSAGTCNRVDEMAYDPEQQIVAVANDEPTGLPPFLSFVTARAPYHVVGQIDFASEGDVAGNGLEQPLWDPQIDRFLQTLPVTDAKTMTGAIAVIKVGGSPFKAIVERTIPLSGFGCSPTGEALALNGHLVVACSSQGIPSSFPLVIDVATGEEVGAGVDEVGGGDEVNYNPGENEFVVASNVDGNSSNPIVLSAINAESGDFINSAPAGGLSSSGRAGNPAGLGSVNRDFVIVHPATAPATDICPVFVISTSPLMVKDFGCIAVFGPVGPGDKDDKGQNHDNGNGKN
jgi:hypothetical protein